MGDWVVENLHEWTSIHKHTKKILQTYIRFLWLGSFIWISINFETYFKPHKRAFVKAWKKYESIETNILKPKTEDDLEFLQLPKFVEKDQDDGDKIN